MSKEFNRRTFLKLGAGACAAAGLNMLGLRDNLNPVFAKEKELDIEVLMYHETNSDELIKDLMYRLEEGYQPLSTETFIRALNEEISIPTGLKTFYLTLDDGRLSQYRAVMDATEYIEQTTGFFIPATFFVLTKFEDLPIPLAEIPDNTPSYNDRTWHQYQTKRQLVDLIKHGHWIDNHTVNHADLLSVSIDVRNGEVVSGQEKIKALWNLAGKEKPYDIFAYPNGSYNPDQIEFLNYLGYAMAFSTRPTTYHTLSGRLFAGRIRMS